MGSDESEGYTFVCPECEEQLALNEPMKETLIERGCVICGTAVTEAAFTDGSFGGSS